MPKVTCYGCHYIEPSIISLEEIGIGLHDSERFFSLIIQPYPYHIKHKFKFNFRHLEDIISALNELKGEYVTQQLGQGN